jgi:crotonobetainyl-CoA:carnitine CoA-transferase CaiB-like acyl-CoA transferase
MAFFAVWVFNTLIKAKGGGKMGQPLEGIRVVDLSRVLAGPFCTMILGDLGADVIKIESPGGSDDTRAWGPPFVAGESAYYLCTNRNKKGMTLNLKTEDGRRILKTLIKDADVLIQNFRVGMMEKWGLDYNTLHELNPRLVYCSISGFGATGPYRQMAGYDYMIQAMGGLMSVTGSEESGPIKVGVAIADVTTALYSAIAILAALKERDRSGEGQAIDMALMDAEVSSLINVASNYLISGEIPRLLGNVHPNVAPYQTFPTADGEMVIAAGNDKLYRLLCEALGAPELIDDPRFKTNSDRVKYRLELAGCLSERLRTEKTKVWVQRLIEAGVPAAPINNMEQVFSDPQVMAREMVVPMEHPTAGPIHLVGSPIKLSRTPVQYRKHPPVLGEHTEEILTALGYDEAAIQSLKTNGVI